MSGQANDTAGEIVLGPWQVAADRAAIASFALALGQDGLEPPATFPIVWLSLPALKQALHAALGPGHLPIHESQSFDYERPLEPGALYVLSGAARRESGPDRLVVTTRAAAPDGSTVVAMRSVLRIVAMSGDGVK